MRARNRPPARSETLDIAEEKDHTETGTRAGRANEKELFFLSSTHPPPSFFERETIQRRKKNYERTDANNAAVVAAVTAALESFSDKLDAWTVLLTELF